MPTGEAYLEQSIDLRLARLARLPDNLAAAMHGHNDAVLSRRPTELSEQDQVSKTEILRRVLALYKYLENETRDCD